MNKQHTLTIRDPNRNHEYRRLTGNIRDVNYNFFVIEYNPAKTVCELIVRDKTPVRFRSRHQWYVLCEDTYDYCLGFLNGKFNNIEIKTDYGKKDD